MLCAVTSLQPRRPPLLSVQTSKLSEGMLTEDLLAVLLLETKIVCVHLVAHLKPAQANARAP